MNICVLGDSITWGACDWKQGGWVTQLRNYFEERGDTPLGSDGKLVDVAVYNLGISGNTTQDLLARFDQEARSRQATCIIFAIGINDSKYFTTEDDVVTSEVEFKKNVSALIKAAKIVTSNIAFVGLNRVDETKTTGSAWGNSDFFCNKNIEKYDLILKSMCVEEKVTYIEVANALSLEDLEDGLHPNTQGHKKMFRRILPEVVEILNGK